jgi:hypothetical protein
MGMIATLLLAYLRFSRLVRWSVGNEPSWAA